MGYTEMVRAEMVKPESLVKVLVGETIPIDECYMNARLVSISPL